AVTGRDLINWPELRDLFVVAHLSIKNLRVKKPLGGPAGEARKENNILPGIRRRQRCSWNRGSGHAGSPFCKGDDDIGLVVRPSACGLKQQRRQHNNTGYYYPRDGIFVGDHRSLSFRFVGVGSWVFWLDAVDKCDSSFARRFQLPRYCLHSGKREPNGKIRTL